MKKRLPSVLAVCISVVVGILISSAVYAATGFSIFGRFREKPLPEGYANNAELSALAYRVLDNIKAGDYGELALTAHPKLGVLFSPQATVDKLTNKCFSAEQIAEFKQDNNAYVWGVNSTSGEPIELTPIDYFAKFVYPKDYVAAPFVGINHIVRSGNALENIQEVFPEIQFVEFHIPGSGQNAAEDFDWCTLRLGFEVYDGSLWLTAIIHSKWSA